MLWFVSYPTFPHLLLKQPSPIVHTGDINWVQCDRCEKWFHLLCIGLGEDEVSENEDYVCYTCKHPRPKPRQKLPGGITIPAATTTPASATSSAYDFHDEDDGVVYQSPPTRPSMQSVHQGLPAMPHPPSQIAQPQPYRPAHAQQSVAATMPQTATTIGPRTGNIEDLLAAAESQFMVDQEQEAQEAAISHHHHHQVIDNSVDAEVVEDDDDDDDDDDETVDV